jgi:farnesyl-diphosphate farnesyltransferase
MSGRECYLGEVDEAWCYEAVQGVSRTFALTVDVLEEPMSTHICLGYLLCRVADTVEDAGHLAQ